MPNTPQFLISYWASLRIGAIVVPINPLLSGPEVRTQLNIVTPRVLIVLDSIYAKIQNQLDDCPIQYVVLTSIADFMPFWLRLIFFFKDKLPDKNNFSFQDSTIWFKKLLSKQPIEAAAGLKSSDIAVLLFTGGVTGTPKAVSLTHRNLVANVLQTSAWLGELKGGHDVVLGVLPFFHSYGMTACHHLAIQSGAMLIVEPRFNVKRAMRLVKRYKVTIFPGVPTMFRAIINDIIDTKKRLDYIRVCVSGGAPLSHELKLQFETWTASTLVEGYGLSEASPLTHCNPLVGAQHIGSIGLPCPNTQARIVHLKSGKTLPPKRLGELQVRGPQVMASYWKNAKETAHVFSADGWLLTGDIGFMDEDGFFYIVDRKKDIILTGGFNVYPSEVEAVLLQHSDVKECAVVGVDEEYYGQIIRAYIVTKNRAHCEKEKLVSFCQERLAHYKIPKQFEFIDDLPKNFLGKIVRRKLIAHI